MKGVFKIIAKYRRKIITEILSNTFIYRLVRTELDTK